MKEASQINSKYGNITITVTAVEQLKITGTRAW